MRILISIFLFSLLHTQSGLSQVKPVASVPPTTEVSATPSPTSLPPENIEGAKLPELSRASEIATTILSSMTTRDATASVISFFPKDAFLRLKDMPGSAQYYDKLQGWFLDDVKKEIAKHPDALSYHLNSFKPGSCKWKKVGSEYNKVAYWSCRKSSALYTVTLKNGKEISGTIEILTMINWGSKWYVTHLGPIPK